MFLEAKMTSVFLRGTVIVVLLTVVIALVLYNTKLIDACPLRQVYVTYEIKKFDQTKDPQLCDELNGKISQFDTDRSEERRVGKEGRSGRRTVHKKKKPKKS